MRKGAGNILAISKLLTMRCVWISLFYYFFTSSVDVVIYSAYKRLHPKEEEEESKKVDSVKSSPLSVKKMRNEDDKEFSNFVEVQKVNAFGELVLFY